MAHIFVYIQPVVVTTSTAGLIPLSTEQKLSVVSVIRRGQLVKGK